MKYINIFFKNLKVKKATILYEIDGIFYVIDKLPCKGFCFNLK